MNRPDVKSLLVGTKAKYLEKSIAQLSKPKQNENIDQNEISFCSDEKSQSSSTKKRKVPEEEQSSANAPKRRLKKLKNLEEEESEQKVTVKISKEEPKSPEKRPISYEEQAANYVRDKLEKFKFVDNSTKAIETKKTEKFKYVDDSNNKGVKTLDDWKNKTDTKKEEKKTVEAIKEPKEKKDEKRVEIDPKAYFSMFAGKSSKKAVVEPPKPVVMDIMDLEEEIDEKQTADNRKVQDSEPKTSDITPQKEPEASENQATMSEKINNLKVSEFEEPKEYAKPQHFIAKQEAKTPINSQNSEISAKPVLKENIIQKKGPLSGLSFTILGVLNSVSNEELIDLLKSLGAGTFDKVDDRVYGLIVGTNLEDGRDVKSSKEYTNALRLGLKIYNEIEFDQYLSKTAGKRLSGEECTVSTQATSATSSHYSSFKANFSQTPKNEPSEMIMEISATKPKPNNSNPMNSWVKKPSQPQVQQAKPATLVEQLWTDKYAPKNMGEIVGNQDMVRNLMTWLKDWDDVIIHGNKKAQKFNPNQGKDNWGQANLNARACLVSGPPGIGKTTSVRLIAKTMGYEVVEQNASDVRNKVAVEGHLKHLTDNCLVSFSGDKATNKKFLILMDEVDGMSSGDRGGNQVLINAIKTTKIPIICICNDRQHPKVRSLANHCYDLRYQKPQKSFVARRLKEILTQEKVNIDMNSLEYLCENFGNDIRQMINFLQMNAKRSQSLSYADIKGSFHKVKKDQTVMMNNFDAAKIIMGNHNDISLREKIDLFFIDYDLIPLLVQENYLSNNSRASDEDLMRIAVAADMISTGDILSRSIRNNGEWGLLPSFAFIGTIFPSEIAQTQINFPKFPEWLGKNSSQRKKIREVRELRAMTSSSALVNSQDIVLDYSKSLLDLVNYNLSRGDKNCIEDVVEIMEHYNISPDVIKEHLADIHFPPLKDALSQIPTQIKSSLTKTYNAKFKSSVKATKSKKKIGEGEAGAKRFNSEAEDEEAGGHQSEPEDEANEDEEEQVEVEIKPTKQQVKAKESKGRSSKKNK